jgi:hypothetical protein
VIHFQETSSASRGTYLRVINGPFSLGWIAVPPNGGRYRYYEPESNDHTPVLSGPDLAVLKERIAARH